MSNFKPLELEAFERALVMREAELQRAHYDAHSLICDTQDDACTVPASVAVHLHELGRRFAISRSDDTEATFMSRVPADDQGVDFVALFVALTPNNEGRYSVTSLSDTFEAYDAL